MARAERLPEEELTKERDVLVKRASRSGLKALLTRRGDVNGFGEVTKIASTTLVGQFFQALNYEDGALWYRRFSAVIHGTPYGLLDFYVMKSATGSVLETSSRRFQSMRFEKPQSYRRRLTLERSNSSVDTTVGMVKVLLNIVNNYSIA
ncbi:MAG TPA: hypothetical protein VMV53_00505 [Acidimicrobiales bacterium]|nr:hypothetical protein [Acidimicrobiales bacterium]